MSSANSDYLLIGIVAGIIVAFVAMVTGLAIFANPGTIPPNSSCPKGYIAYFRPGHLYFSSNGHYTTGSFECFRPQDRWPTQS